MVNNEVPKLTPDQKAELLQKIKAQIQKEKEIPDSRKHPITNPEKYGFPLGMDENGTSK